MTKNEKIISGLVWVIFPAGVLWEYLGWFEWIMQHSSGLFIALITLFGMSHIYRQTELKNKKYLILFSAIIFAGGMLAEIAGVQTGIIFGAYNYGDRLGIKLGGVPLAIGFAWLMMTSFSLNIVRYFPAMIRIPSAALLATLFDMCMEPAAIRLNFWHWNQDVIPWQNFTAWYILSFIFCAVLDKIQNKNEGLSVFILNLFLVQIVYFLLILMT